MDQAKTKEVQNPVQVDTYFQKGPVKLRRVNFLLYLNDDWREEYGGALSLYDSDLKPWRSVLPVGNRFVVFATTRDSYHGHPERMMCPEGVYRKSIALYYYSMPTGRDKSRIIFPRAEKGFEHSPTTE